MGEESARVWSSQAVSVHEGLGPNKELDYKLGMGQCPVSSLDTY